MQNDQSLREHLLYVLQGEGAHPGFDAAVKDLPPALRGKRPPALPHSPWEIVEHIRLAQTDILEYTRDPKHVSLEFPAGYWPSTPAPSSDEAWNKGLEAFRAGIDGFVKMVQDKSNDLLAPLAHAKGTSIMGQVLLAADHNAYHLGQLVLVRRMLGAWE